MNNYSTLQRLLHRIVLSSELIRKIIYDIEQSIFLNKNYNSNKHHVFIAGLARSGTTILMNAIYKSNKFASLTYEDMPFILAPNLWGKVNRNFNSGQPKQRAHGDRIRIYKNSPEAFEEVFWKTFDLDSITHEELFTKYISLILKKNGKTNYLSKNNQNIRRLDLISKILPNSIILIPFRDPLQQALSLFFQHKRFIKLQNEDSFARDYMKWIGHSEFGLDYKMIHSTDLSYPNHNEFNHWLEQWLLTYRAILDLCGKHKGIYLISYESLCDNPAVWDSIKVLLELNQETNFKFKKAEKPVDQTFDENLFKKCYRLHESLSSKSFGF